MTVTAKAESLTSRVTAKELKQIQREINRCYWQFRASDKTLRSLSIDKGKDVVTTFLLKMEFKRLNE